MKATTSPSCLILGSGALRMGTSRRCAAEEAPIGAEAGAIRGDITRTRAEKGGALGVHHRSIRGGWSGSDFQIRRSVRIVNARLAEGAGDLGERLLAPGVGSERRPPAGTFYEHPLAKPPLCHSCLGGLSLIAVSGK